MPHSQKHYLALEAAARVLLGQANGRGNAAKFESIARVWHAERERRGREPHFDLKALGLLMGLEEAEIMRIKARCITYVSTARRAMMPARHLRNVGNNRDISKWTTGDMEGGRRYVLDAASGEWKRKEMEN